MTNVVADRIKELMESHQVTRLQEEVRQLKEVQQNMFLAAVEKKNNELKLLALLRQLTGFLTVTGQSPPGYEEALVLLVQHNLEHGDTIT